MNKIIWTKTIKSVNEQLSFSLPTGYKIYTPNDVVILNTEPTIINLGVKIYSERPITLMYTKAITCADFLIIDSNQMIGAHQSTDLFITVINPDYKERSSKNWVIKKDSCIASMIPIDTSYTNLFEVSNSVYEKYV